MPINPGLTRTTRHPTPLISLFEHVNAITVKPHTVNVTISPPLFL
jgi:hypothetical protein